MKRTLMGLFFIAGLFLALNAAAAPKNAANLKGTVIMKTKELNLTDEWDKTFPKSEKVNHKKVTFVNRYGIPLAADVYEPKNAKGKLPALAVSGPFGAVKEQASGLYAQTMAERGFLTLAFDPSYTGESGGEPRNVASPDINTEDFMAAVDFLSVQKNVDPDQIGIIGICGFGGLALNAAALDTRIKATVTSTMYDMTRVTANGYFDNENSEEARYEKRKTMSLQRTEDYKNGVYASAGALPDIAPDGAPQFLIDYIGYYRNRERGFHPRSQGEGLGWNATGCESFLNMPILQYSSEIRSAVLIIHGEKAHSCYFSKDAYANMIKNNPHKDNKELLLIPDAVHTDLYDRTDIIPFDTIEAFFRKNLTQK
jgi:Hydrolases of the alpha/beta superfamily